MKPPYKSVATNFIETKIAEERALEMLRMAERFYPEPIRDDFVSETRDELGRQVVESLWIFTDTTMGEFKNFLSEENFDAVPLGEVLYLEAKSKDFTLGTDTAKEQSRLAVDIQFTQPSLSATLKASGKNCTELLRITQKWFLPRIAARSDLR